MKKERRTIYIDMDGVVADFDSYASNIVGRNVGWDHDDLTSEEWAILAKVPNLYFQLPLIEQSVPMVGLCKSFASRANIEFLTAIPRKTTMPSAKQDKIDWINEFFPGIPVNFGPYSHDKHKWARPGDILIDDKKSNIEEWGAAGGIPIHHLGDYTLTKQLILYSMAEPNDLFNYLDSLEPS
jgi:5'(3')-deoxyribonucleotidase